MRILVGTVEVSGSLPDLADGFRQLGHEVTSVIRVPHFFYPANRYDVDIRSPVAWPASIERIQSPLVRFPRGAIDRIVRSVRVLQLIATHDLFVFIWGGLSLTEGNREFRLLKRLGKRIVSIFMGDDIRHGPSFIKQYQHSELSSEFIREYESGAKSFLKRLRALRLAEKFSDLILSHPNQSNLAIRPYMDSSIPMNLSRYRCSIPARDVPIVVHAPSSHSVKGTKQILKTLAELKDEGVQFELRLLDNVSNEEVISGLADADVVVDQLYFAGCGKLALEAMASGCALAKRAYDVFSPSLPKEPVWHIETGNLYPQLKRLLTDRELRIRLAAEGRKYVDRYHDHVQVAQRILELLGRQRIDEYDYYPTYFARYFSLDDGEIIPTKLKKITTELVQQWGLPEDVDPRAMAARGLMFQVGLDVSHSIPRWTSGKFHDPFCSVPVA